jgi:hypothetical protein
METQRPESPYTPPTNAFLTSKLHLETRTKEGMSWVCEIASGFSFSLFFFFSLIFNGGESGDDMCERAEQTSSTLVVQSHRSGDAELNTHYSHLEEREREREGELFHGKS